MRAAALPSLNRFARRGPAARDAALFALVVLSSPAGARVGPQRGAGAYSVPGQTKGLSMTDIVHSETRSIPLNKLVVSADNVRRTNGKTDIEALAASIRSHGLLQNLSVTDQGDGTFAVVAGGRRLAALKSLARSGVFPKDYPTPCRVVASQAAPESSLAENVQRVAMDPIDESDAFAALVAEGRTEDDIARRFGITRRHVEQRLALAGLSPRLKSAWKRGDLNLDAAKAFCLVADHRQQDAVFRSLSKPVTQAASVRSRLMEGRMRANDRHAVFVGLDPYEAAGGKLSRDLFEDDAVFVEDPALIFQLAEAELERQAAVWRAEGWGWVAVNLDGAALQGLSSRRVHPSWRQPTDDEAKELERLTAAIEALDAALEADSVEDDPRWSERDDLEAAYETIRQAAHIWDPAQIALAGVSLGIAYDGSLSVTKGLVRASEEAALARLRAGDDDTERTSRPSDAERKPSMPRTLIRQLTEERTRALRSEVIQRPGIALAICVASLAAKVWSRENVAGVSLTTKSCHCDDDEMTSRALGEWANRFESIESPLAWALSASRDDLMDCLAHVVAALLDFANEAATPHDRNIHDSADQLACAIDLDMSRRWKADLDFWLKLPKALLLEALAESPVAAAKGEAKAAAFLAASAKLKKAQLAEIVSEAFAEAGWLPDVLVTPVGAGAYEVVVASGSASESASEVAA